MSYTMPSSLRAANDTLFPSIFSLAVLWIVNIAMAYVLAIPAGLGLVGVWVAQWLSWIVRTVGFYLRYRGLNWAACRKA